MFYAIDPFDETRADRRAARVAQVIYNMNRASAAPAATLDQFLLYKEPEPEESAEDAAKRIRSQIFATGRVVTKRRKPKQWQH